MKILATVALAAMLAAGTAAAASPSPTHPEMRYAVEDGSGPTFSFSAAAASASDPVVISVVGRQLAASDRQWRTQLQRIWLGSNVPPSFSLVERAQVACPSRKKGEFGRCDLYTFTDPDGGERGYHFYISQWP